MKPTCMPNTGQLWLGLDYASWSWNHPIESCNSARHRRNLVEKGGAMACQIREHLHLAMPGFANLFDRLFERPAALAIACRCESPAKLIELGQVGLSRHLQENGVR